MYASKKYCTSDASMCWWKKERIINRCKIYQISILWTQNLPDKHSVYVKWAITKSCGKNYFCAGEFCLRILSGQVIKWFFFKIFQYEKNLCYRQISNIVYLVHIIFVICHILQSVFSFFILDYLICEVSPIQ